jgi:peptidoglycan hydrolase-like protein with peptidoglycan-binding domain
MAYTRTTDTSKPDQNTKLLADSLDAAVNGAISTYNEQVTAEDNAAEANFQSLVAAGNMSLNDQLSYRQNQLKGTTDSATRASIRTAISTLQAQINQKAFSDAYTTQLQNNAAGIESTQSVVDWLTSQLTTATDTTVIAKIQSELVTQQGNLFSAQQKALSDQTTYAKNSGNMTTINNQITALASAKSQALLNGDPDTAANLDLQIQSLQQFVSEQGIVTTMQNLATATVTGSSSATDLLSSYNTQIQTADTTTPITVNGTTYASAQAFWTYTRDAYIADTSSSGLFSRITKEATDAVTVAQSNNTLSTSNLTAINAEFTQLSSNPILAPYAAQIATAKATALQTAANALATKVEYNYDQSLDLNTALTALQAISAQGANVDSTTQSILNSAAQTQSQAVQSIMSAASQLQAANPGMSITDAVTKAVASGAGAIVSNNGLLSTTPAATATDQLTKDAAGTAAAPTSTTIGGAPAATPTSSSQISALPNLQPGDTGASVTQLQNWLISQGYNIADGATGNYGPETQAAVSAWQKANNINTNGNDGYFGPASKSFISSQPVTMPTATPVATPAATTPTGTTATTNSGVNVSIPTAASTAASTGAIDYTLHAGETIAQYNARIAAATAQLQQSSGGAKTTAPTTPAAAPATTAPTSSPTPTPSPTLPVGGSPSSTPSSAPTTIRSSDPYNPPTGLTTSKTAAGGTAYTDKDGNLYTQTSPGIYTLNNSLK